MTHLPFHNLTLLEEGIAGAMQLWATVQEVSFMAAIIWTLNAVVHLAGKTYQAGRTVGAFYFAHLHAHVVTACKWLWREGTKWLGLLLYLMWLGCVYLYEHRREILAGLNGYRERISTAFTYRY